MWRDGLGAGTEHAIHAEPRTAGAVSSGEGVQTSSQAEKEDSGSPHWQRLGVAITAANGESKRSLAEGVRA